MPRRKAMTVYTPDLVAGDRMEYGNCLEEVVRIDLPEGANIAKVYVRRLLQGDTEWRETWFYSGRNALHEINRASTTKPTVTPC